MTPEASSLMSKISHLTPCTHPRDREKSGQVFGLKERCDTLLVTMGSNPTRHSLEVSMDTDPTIDDFRAAIARQRLTRYELAAQVGVHPARFGRMLNGKEPMPTWVHENICQALRIIKTDGAA